MFHNINRLASRFKFGGVSSSALTITLPMHAPDAVEEDTTSAEKHITREQWIKADRIVMLGLLVLTVLIALI